MPKASNQSAITTEIKKEFLNVHLEEVLGYYSDWITQLNAPEPFAPNIEGFGWTDEYQPSVEADPDINHILHRHIKGRAFWHYHAEWLHQISEVWQLIIKIREEALGQLPLSEGNAGVEVRNNYIGTALLGAYLSLKRNRKVKMNYQVPVSGTGLVCGDGYAIDLNATGETDRTEVELKHTALAESFKTSSELEQVWQLWASIEETQHKMADLLRKTIRSKDILYPCRFCKHFWK